MMAEVKIPRAALSDTAKNHGYPRKNFEPVPLEKGDSSRSKADHEIDSLMGVLLLQELLEQRLIPGIGEPEFGGYEQLVARHTAPLDPFADGFLVFVRCGCVDRR